MNLLFCPMQIMEDAPKESKKSLRMRLLKKLLPLLLVFCTLASGVPLFALQQADEGGLLAKDYTMGKKYHDRVKLIETGQEGAEVRLDLIESAQSSIDISYYTFTRGSFTQVFLACLLTAADRGVHVRILCDGLTRLAYEKKELKEALRGFETHPNMEVKYYEKFNLLKPWAWQRRLHDKLIIVDGKLALIGGRNIGDKYFIKEEYKQRFVNDRDVLIYHEGTEPSVIGDMQLYYDQGWEYKHTKVHRKKITKGQIARGELSNQRLRDHYRMVSTGHPELFQPTAWKEQTYPTESIQFAHNPLGRKNKDPRCLKVLLQLASKARSSIFVQSPYIIPTKAMRNLIEKYDIDMGLVTVLTNSKRSSPNPIAMGGYYNHRKNIVDKVDQVHEYQGPDSIHGKSYIIDEAISIVGTFNLDSRSSYINTESMVIIHSEQFASHLRDEIQPYMESSVLVQDDYTYGGVAEDRKPLWLFSKLVGLFEYYL